jgi:hypothetical protein
MRIAVAFLWSMAVAGPAAAQTTVALQLTAANIAFGTAGAVSYSNTGANAGYKVDATPQTLTLIPGGTAGTRCTTVYVSSPAGLAGAPSGIKAATQLEFAFAAGGPWTPIAASETVLVPERPMTFGGANYSTPVYWRVALHSGDVASMATASVSWTGTVTFRIATRSNVPAC